MHSLSHILGEKRQYKKWLNEADLLATLRRNSAELLGQLDAHIRIGFVQEGILILETEQYAWVNEINFFKPQLIEKINGVLGKKNGIRDVKVRVQKLTETIRSKGEKTGNSLSLEEKIKRDNEEKSKKGWKLCQTCGKTYAETEVCLFCG